MSSHISVPSVLITNLLKSSMCNCFWTSQSNGLPGGGGGGGAIAPSRKCIAFLVPRLPAQKALVASFVCRWLQRPARWNHHRSAVIGMLTGLLQQMSSFPPSGGRLRQGHNGHRGCPVQSMVVLPGAG